MSKENFKRQDKYLFISMAVRVIPVTPDVVEVQRAISGCQSPCKSIAESLNMSFDRFSLAQYLRIVNGALSLREKFIAPHEYACVALNQQTNQCTIYEHRPEQCRTFSFGKRIKDSQKSQHDTVPASFLDS